MSKAWEANGLTGLTTQSPLTTPHTPQPKQHTDEARLFRYCLACADEQEFFIHKTIGWALREYAYTSPDAVRDFIDQHRAQFSTLTIRKTSKHLCIEFSCTLSGQSQRIFLVPGTFVLYRNPTFVHLIQVQGNPVQISSTRKSTQRLSKGKTYRSSSLKKYSLHLLIFCAIAVGITTVHTATADAARCPEGGVVSSFDVEITPELECLQVEMIGRCLAVDLIVSNRCDQTVTLRQSEAGCQTNNERLGDEGAQAVIADCVTEVLKPHAVDEPGKSSANWGVPARAEDREIVLNGTYGDTPLRVKVTYSAAIVPYPTSNCRCSSLNQTTPLAPLSLLSALTLAGAITARNRRRQ